MNVSVNDGIPKKPYMKLHWYQSRVETMEQVCDPVFARVDQLLALLTKSKLLHILYLLNSKSSSMRFSDIKKSVDSSSTTITRRLKELEDNGLIIRTDAPNYACNSKL